MTTGQSVEPNSLCGAEVVSSDDHLPPNSSTQQKAQVHAKTNHLFRIG